MNEGLGQKANKLSRIYKNMRYFRDSSADDTRCDFSKDKDRIIFSKAFRRLGHKTQVYTHTKGDHYRTRLTHTLEVAQIAQSIAKMLNVNVELCLAIAYGHDVGHAPFGHEGERVLNRIMTGRDDLGGVIKLCFNHGGFKHNYNALRVLSKIEKKYPENMDKNIGMNLTWETMEGILKHTQIKNKANKCICNIEKYLHLYKNYFIEGGIDLLCYDHSVTLEGQIVAIADEIAQRQHDLDDGFMDDGLGIQLNDFIDNLRLKLNVLIKSDSPDLKNNQQSMCDDLKKIQDSLNNGIDMLLAQDLIIRWVLNYMIHDVNLYFKDRFHGRELTGFHFKGKKCFSEKCIDFSPFGKEVSNHVADFISTEIVNSYEVNSQDGKAMYIIRNLFKAYHNNPRQMPKYVLENIYRKIRKTSENYGSLSFISEYVREENIYKIKKRELNKLIAILRLNKEAFDDEYFTKHLSHEDESNFPKKIMEYLGKYKRNSGKIVDPSEEDLTNDEKFIYAINHHYIFEICDYISGMTDNYCLSEYKKLFQVN